MAKELTDAQKITRLRSNLATRAAHTIKNKYIDEYQEVYYSLLDEYGLAPSTKVKHMQVLWNENKKLKQMLKQMSAQGKVEVIEFEDDRSWNYPKPKEQDDNE
jgi:hypothetical protein